MTEKNPPALAAANPGPASSFKDIQSKQRIFVTQEIIRNAHLYHARKDGKEFGPFGSVTRYLKIIDKSGPLMHWAAKIALANAKEELLLSGGSEPKILEPDFINGIIQRAAARPLKEFEKAGDFGTKAHAYFNDIVNGRVFGIPPEDAELVTVINGMNNFIKECGIKIIQGDTKVVSLKHEYGGSFDAIAMRDGAYGIIDFKTSNGCYPEMALQVAAYAQATRETFGIYPKWGMILRFSKTKPEYEIKQIAHMRQSFLAFLAAKQLTNLMRLEHFKTEQYCHGPARGQGGIGIR